MAVIFKTISNKTKTPGKNIIQEAVSSPQGDVLMPFIDKLSIVVTPPHDDDAQAIHSNIWTQFEDTNVFQSAEAKALKGWNAAKLIALKSCTARPLLQYRHAGKKAQKLRLEFNPRKIGSKGISELQSVMTSVCNDGWDYVLAYGRVSRIDIAVDIADIRVDEFLFLPKQAATEMQWGVGGHVETFRHGLPKGNQTVVYSVKKKRQKQGKPWLSKSVVRVERRLRNPAVNKLSDLGKLPNPFAGMTLAHNMPGPPAGKNEDKRWSQFEDSVNVRGVRAALALLDEDRRTRYRLHLKQHTLPWWNPEAIWAKWPAVVEDLKIASQ